MSTSKIKVRIEESCKAHPLFSVGSSVPRTAELEVSPRRLFGFGSLALQNPDVEGRRTPAEAEGLWSSLNELYGVFLEFTANNITASPPAEDLIKLSEYVGVGCGLAALCEQLDLNVNRISRFIVGGTQRRADFEFYSGGNRFFHETKGTTHKKRITGLRKDIKAQKGGTVAYCAANGPEVAASSGSVALYRHTSRNDFASEVIFIDPPTGDQPGAREVRTEDELICVLNYYKNIYALTYRQAPGRRLVNIATWVSQIIGRLREGFEPPTSAPQSLFATPRLTERHREANYAGTILDSRTTIESARKYKDFEEASRNERAPVRFVGLAEDVTSLIRACDWGGLLAYRQVGEQGAKDNANTELLSSGVIIRDIEGEEELEAASRNLFNALHKRFA
ncbi:MAG: hypothetical protein JWQ49_3102 [Edaphobacter sp.]|nr:hypothetical protein [Edaphobacter sp.]